MKKNSIYLIILLIAFISCSEEKEPFTPVTEGETQVSIVLQVSEMSTRSDNEDASAIETLSILVFGKNSEASEYEFIYKVTAAPNEEGNYTVSLRSTDNPAKLFLVANNTDLSAVQSGDTPAKVTKSLIIPFTENGFHYLPMSTIVDLENLPSGETIEIQDVKLVRAVAGIKVYMDETKTNLLDDFTLKSIQVYRANSHIQLIPDQLTNNKVSAASVPSVSIPTITSQRIEVPTGQEETQTLLDGLYVPESKPVTNPQDIQTTATCLILGGYYQNSNTETYYRVDFGNTEKNNLGQLLRNHQYTIKITEVTGPGTIHPEDAVDANIKTIIYGWGESKHPLEL